MNAIINEASGERAMHHVLQLVPYQFVRPPSEYQGHFRESEVDGEAGQGVRLHQRRPSRTSRPARRGSRPSASCGSRRRAPRRSTTSSDIPESVASTNANADITGDLIERRAGHGAGLRRQGRQGEVRAVAGAERTRRRLQPRRGRRRDRRARHQRDRRRGPRRRLSGSDRLDHGDRAAEHRGLGAVAEEGAAARNAAQPRAEGDDPLDQQERAGPEQAGDRPRRDRR